MSTVKFRVGTYDQYQALVSAHTVDDDALYFLTDAKKIFKGDADMTENVVSVSEFPTFANAFADKLYISASTLEVKMKASGAADWTILVPGYVTGSESVIAPNNGKVPTVSALIAYVAAQITALRGVANGLAELDANGKVPSAQLPSYVDDIVEGYYYNDRFYVDDNHTTEITPESGKIYVNLAQGDDQNKTYRWSGSAYVVISETLALGETSSTAYRGDRGKTAYDHSQLISGNPHNVTKTDIGLSNVTNDKQMKAATSSSAGGVVVFSGTSGDEVQNSGKIILDTGSLGNSSSNIPTANVVAEAIQAATLDLVTQTAFNALSDDVDAIDSRLATAEGDISTLQSAVTWTVI